MEEILFRWIMHLMYVFILQKNNQTSKKCLCKFGQMIMHPPVYMHKVRIACFMCLHKRLGSLKTKLTKECLCKCG